MRAVVWCGACVTACCEALSTVTHAAALEAGSDCPVAPSPQVPMLVVLLRVMVDGNGKRMSAPDAATSIFHAMFSQVRPFLHMQACPLSPRILLHTHTLTRSHVHAGAHAPPFNTHTHTLCRPAHTRPMQVTMLLLGGFSIAAALSKHFIAKQMAVAVLSRVGRWAWSREGCWRARHVSRCGRKLPHAPSSVSRLVSAPGVPRP